MEKLKLIQEELSDKDVKIAEIKLDCIKVASKHSFSYADILKQSKELFELIDILKYEDVGQITRQAI